MTTPVDPFLSPTSSDERPLRPGTRRVDLWLRVVVGVGIVGGVALRIWLLVLPTGATDSDEAVVGLMALHLVEDGEVATFFWGQFYGGTLEAMLAAPLFAAFGATPLVLKFVPMGLSALAAVLVWRLGRRTVGADAGAVAGVAMWLWPLNMVWFSTRERGFYWVCLVLGIVLLLLALQIADRPRLLRWWLLFGFVAGLGWWTSPQILYFAVPASVWLTARLRTAVWPSALAALGATCIGALPWLIFNARHGWPSLGAGNRGQDAGVLGNAWVLLHEGVPVILGLHTTGRWLVEGLFPVLYVGLVALIGVRVARHPRGTTLLLLGLAAYLPLYAMLPVSGVVGEGRYVLFLLPFLALLIARAAGTRRIQTVFLAGTLVLSVVTVPILDGNTSPHAIDRPVPEDISPLIEALEERDIQHVATDYWLAYRLTFQSGRNIVAGSAIDRHPPYESAVDADPEAAWVFIDGTYLIESFESELAQRGIAAERWRVGVFVVFEPDATVTCWPVPPVVDAGCA